MYINPLYYKPDFVKQLQEKVQADMLAGVQLTEFASEGTTIKGVIAAPTKELVDAIDFYWDEYNGNLITELTPDFSMTI